MKARRLGADVKERLGGPCEWLAGSTLRGRRGTLQARLARGWRRRARRGRVRMVPRGKEAAHGLVLGDVIISVVLGTPVCMHRLEKLLRAVRSVAGEVFACHVVAAAVERMRVCEALVVTSSVPD